MTMATVRRNTKQISVILDTIKMMPRHFTADDVYEEVKKEYPGLGQATVFRNLNKMAEEGILLRIEVPGGAREYELRAPKHYHAKCMKCGKLFDIEMDYMPNLEKKVKDAHGFQFSGHDIIFTGLCSSCIKKQDGNNMEDEK